MVCSIFLLYLLDSMYKGSEKQNMLNTFHGSTNNYYPRESK